MNRPQTILFGNGLNRLTPGCPSWSDLLAGIDNNTRRCENFDKIPFTFQYEALLPENYYHQKEIPTPLYKGKKLDWKYDVESELEVKRRICNTLGKLESNPFYERLAGLNVQNYVTTNCAPI